MFANNKMDAEKGPVRAAWIPAMPAVPRNAGIPVDQWRYTMKNLTVYEANPFSLIDQFFTRDLFDYEHYRSPSIDVYEENDRYVLEAELPGLSEKDIKLEMKDDVLTLATASKEEKKDSSDRDGRWIRRERREFKFTRSFTIPQDADRERIEARFRDGLLTVDIPKKPETAPRTVPVKVA